MNFEPWYNKNYKKLLIIPAIILALSLIYIGIFYLQTGDIIHKDVSLTGGTTITIQTSISQEILKEALSKTISDFEIKTVSNNAGIQKQLIVIVGESEKETLEITLEDFLGYNLTTENNVSKETTSSSLSADFYKQLIVAVLLAFFWMAAVVFLIFSKGKKLKFWTIVLNILLGFFMGNYFLTINPIISAIIFATLAILLITIYIKNSVPAFAVMLSAFSNIIMTLAIVDLVGMKVSTAGIVAFLMLIGYSVDTDILLTTRLLKKHKSTNAALLGAFKTGTTMTITSIIAVAVALILVFSFESVLNQIFTILLIGLSFDLFNTWITNASIIKWHIETK
jgi:preprotein translocase subunit SecF